MTLLLNILGFPLKQKSLWDEVNWIWVGVVFLVSLLLFSFWMGKRVRKTKKSLEDEEGQPMYNCPDVLLQHKANLTGEVLPLSNGYTSLLSKILIWLFIIWLSLTPMQELNEIGSPWFWGSRPFVHFY